MELFAAMTVFFIFVTMVFIAVALFFPEWMGITGKKAQQIIQDHKAEASSQSEESSSKDSQNP